ncbi:phospho-sugar mutase [Jatrophihabitans lederbergiae]|uniref:Phospho-sugar mutase n=1 Tax=Jatrophihabitans lederbergiae TaxID=3075547 RepID=A0ABU2JAC0_9ACTN|nr:phospho-sugar mutase [Jatrophihabitans sp. DSM 44399]MDT0261907.1 phospho-sugar mutase [Jatrophihabitans sp. DSM 44399]
MATDHAVERSVELSAQVRDWIADDPDEDAAGRLRSLLDRAEAGDEAAAAELAERFAGPLTFGTAGLRGPLREGPNGMNTAVVRRAAAGLAAQLIDAGKAGGIVVIGYDGRHGSQSFARDSAAIFAAAGFDARLLPRMLPTPLLAFAVQRLGAVAGIMVTASHNPPRDNGYKVYAGDGAQIVSPMDRDIEAHIRAVPPVRAIALAESFHTIDESLVSDYVNAIAGLVRPDTPRELDIVHTSMHGVGASVVRAVFAAAGFAAPVEVPEQAEPDPDFSTVAFPNPEEPGAMDLALALARERHADLIIANDPDADRCAVGVPFPDAAGSSSDSAGWRMLRGDEVGALLADWLLRNGVRGTYATTVVSSTLLSSMAAKHGVPFAETLTGFKWISRAAPDLVFGYEEALGYAVAPSLVRDKDGISAALLIAELAASLKAEGSSLPRRLAELAAEYGLHATRQLSWRLADVADISAAMSRLRGNPPAQLLSSAVTVIDLAPDNDVLILRFSGGRVVVRPSGTEPKCKAYLELVLGADAAADEAAREAQADRALSRLGDEVTTALAL